MNFGDCGGFYDGLSTSSLWKPNSPSLWQYCWKTALNCQPLWGLAGSKSVLLPGPACIQWLVDVGYEGLAHWPPRSLHWDHLNTTLPMDQPRPLLRLYHSSALPSAPSCFHLFLSTNIDPQEPSLETLLQADLHSRVCLPENPILNSGIVHDIIY